MWFSLLFAPPWACQGGVAISGKSGNFKIQLRGIKKMDCIEKGGKFPSAHQCEVMNYVEYFKEPPMVTIKKYSTIKHYAFILHDKDVNENGVIEPPHYHIYLNFGKSSVSFDVVAKWFQLEPQYVGKVKGRRLDVLLYLIHGNDSQQHKHQYSPSEVYANFDYTNELATAKILGDFEHYSYAQQLDYVNTLPVSEKPAVYSKLKTLWEIECKQLAKQTDRKLDVIFICGAGGTGKTYYAKKLLKSMNLDFCISSGNNDPFQDYMGQKAIILDDLRDSAFSFADLLKILDNNTVSSVASRFNNKVFNGDVVVITCSVPIKQWYKNCEPKDRVPYDDLKQLYRRISCYVEVEKNTITVFNDGVDDNGNKQGFGQVFSNEIPKVKTESAERKNYCELFSKIAEPLKIDDLDNRQLEIENLKF